MSGQHRLDSVMEVITNTAIGFVISWITWACLARAMRIPVTASDNLLITSVFTMTSLLRQYVLRRLFNGRSPWRALQARCAR